MYVSVLVSSYVQVVKLLINSSPFPRWIEVLNKAGKTDDKQATIPPSSSIGENSQLTTSPYAHYTSHNTLGVMHC